LLTLKNIYIGKDGDGRGWVLGSDQVQGGFATGRFIEAELGNKDVRYMSARQLEIYQETLDESKQSPDDALGDEVCLTTDMGNPLREIPRYKMNPLLIRRRKTDVCCLFILFLFWIFVACVGKYALDNGDTNRLLYGVDSIGNTCGSNNNVVDSSLGVDATDRKYLWWPDAKDEPNYMFCVKKCPGLDDLNSTIIEDYLVKRMDHKAPSKYYIVKEATTSTLNRCLPHSGSDNLKIGSDLIVLADLLNGWKTILLAGGIALVSGLVWILAITRCPKKIVLCTVFGTFLTALFIIIGLVLVAYPTTSSVAKTIVDPTASVSTMISIIFLLIFCMTFFIRFFKKRNLAQYAWPVMDEVSIAIRQIGSGFVIYPIVNFVLFAALGIGGCLLIVQVLSIGKLKQMCECPSNSLSGCKCTQVFEFDVAARWYAAIIFIGTFWHQNIILELTRCVTAGTLSTWFFTDEDEDNERKLLVRFPTYSMFSRILWNHLGTIAYIAFIRPFHVIHRPVVQCLDYQRRKPLTSEFKRSKFLY
jgi:hypothetical protein